MERARTLPISPLACFTILLFATGCGESPSEPETPEADTRASGKVGRGVESSRAPTLLERLSEKADSSADDWETEVLGEAMGARLGRLKKLIEESGALNRDALEALVSADFRCSALRPDELRVAFDDPPFRVSRAELEAPLPADREGTTALESELRALTGGLGRGEDAHAKFKIFEIQVEGDLATTRVWYQAGHHGASGGAQQSATWRVRWELDREHPDRPRIAEIRLEAFEEVHVAQPDGPLFRDHTQSALSGAASYRDQILPGLNHWLIRISRLMGMSIGGHHGVSIADVNGDELEDLYVCDAGGLPNRLYLQRADGTLEDHSADSGLDWLESSSAALLIDLDGDGDRDCALSTRPWILFLENDGSGHFELRSKVAAPSDPMSISCADFDVDGDLDIYVCAYNPRPGRGGVAAPIPYQDANNGDHNRLFRNEGGFRFTDATSELGLDQNNTRYSFASVWEDFDLDGDLDLYVANDFGRNNLYRNEGGRFRDVAGEIGAEDIASGMSVSTGDPNRDGVPDIYVSNMWSSAGNRVTYQRRFTEAHDGGTVAHVQRMARGNTLFMNAGDGSFIDRSVEAGVSLGRWAWGSRFADLNNDGWEDLVVANGYFTMDDPADL